MPNLLQLIHKQEIPTGIAITDLARIIKANDTDIKSAVVHAFYYGCMHGKQQDRKRRKKQLAGNRKLGFAYVPSPAVSAQIKQAYNRGIETSLQWALENVYLLGRVHGMQTPNKERALVGGAAI